MGGIVAVLPGAGNGRGFDVSLIVQSLEALRIPTIAGRPHDERALAHVSGNLAGANSLLSDPTSVHRLVTDYGLVRRLRSALIRLELAAEDAGERLAWLSDEVDSAKYTATQQALVHIAASLWSIGHDRLKHIEAIASFLRAPGDGPGIYSTAAVTGYGAIDTTLRGIHRLARRTRESVALHVWVRGPSLRRLLRTAQRHIQDRRPAHWGSEGVEQISGGMSFTYEATSMNAQPGDNVATLRESIARDILLKRALNTLDAEVSVLANYRCHDRDVEARSDPADGDRRPSSTSPHSITMCDTTAPDSARACANTYADDRHKLVPAFSDFLTSFSGSVAMASQSELAPEALLLGVRGDHRRLCVGMAPSRWIVASEPYGLVGDADRYLLVSGAGNKNEETGSVVVLRKARAGDLAGLDRYRLDGTPDPVGTTDIEVLQCGPDAFR